MLSERSWKNLEASLSTVSHLVAALQRRMAADGRTGLPDVQLGRALEGIADAVPSLDPDDDQDE